jgi:hypothetical protein
MIPLAAPWYFKRVVALQKTLHVEAYWCTALPREDAVRQADSDATSWRRYSSTSPSFPGSEIVS